MARIDKYDPVDGGFRARLGFAPSAGQVGAILGVGLNASGQVVVGAGTTGVLGVICMSSLLSQGDVVDVMTHGEIVDATGLNAGTVYFSPAAGGAPSAAAPAAGANALRIGHTVEAWRLVVRCQVTQG